MGRSYKHNPEEDEIPEEFIDESIGYCDFCEGSHSMPNGDTCRKSFRRAMIGAEITRQGLTPGLVRETFELDDDAA